MKQSRPHDSYTAKKFHKKSQHFELSERHAETSHPKYQSVESEYIPAFCQSFFHNESLGRRTRKVSCPSQNQILLPCPKAGNQVSCRREALLNHSHQRFYTKKTSTILRTSSLRISSEVKTYLNFPILQRSKEGNPHQDATMQTNLHTYARCFSNYMGNCKYFAT